MKTLLLFAGGLFTFHFLSAQAPSIQWQKTLGGSQLDVAHSIQQTSDGGFIVAGRSNSIDGDVTGNHGYADCWVVKLGLCPTNNTTNNIAICPGDSIMVGTSTYSEAGIYTDILQAFSGCDSTVTTVLTVKQPSSSTLTETACGSYTLNGQTYTTSGTHTQVIPNAAGCDSTITLNLTINNPTLNPAISVDGHTISAQETEATYQWIDCDNNNAPMQGATSQSFTATTTGNYAVVLTSAIRRGRKFSAPTYPAICSMFQRPAYDRVHTTHCTLYLIHSTPLTIPSA